MFVVSERYKDGSTTLSSSVEKRIQSACNKDLHKDHRGMQQNLLNPLLLPI